MGHPTGWLGASFTSNLDRATRAAQQLRAGQVFVNEWYAGGVETPFGGFMANRATGAKKGRRGFVEPDVQTKNVAIRLKG